MQYKKGKNPNSLKNLTHRFQTGHKDFISPKKRKISGQKRSGENNCNWKGGIKKSGGYVWILNSSHLKACGSYVKRANLVMEKKIGRLLTKGESIHHINGIKDDDRPENLWLFSSENEHKRYHLRVMNTYKKWTGLKGLQGKVFNEIKRVCGESFGYNDFPAFLRKD